METKIRVDIGSENPRRLIESVKVAKPLLYFQIICFAILNGVWVLPRTMGLRNTCLVAGALMSLYPIYQARSLFLQKKIHPTLVHRSPFYLDRFSSSVFKS